jgi:hypothetical protein
MGATQGTVSEGKQVKAVILHQNLLSPTLSTLGHITRAQ